MPAESAPLRTLRVRNAEATTRNAGKPQFVLEKDYAISYLLAGVAQVPTLREVLVFKGGACLRKAYFPGYRFENVVKSCCQNQEDRRPLRVTGTPTY